MVEEIQAEFPGLSRHGLLATVTEFIARSIAHAYGRFLPGPVDQVILGGGGLHNHLVERLQDLLAPAAVLTHEDFGIPNDAKEAIAFAILEQRRPTPTSQHTSQYLYWKEP